MFSAKPSKLTPQAATLPVNVALRDSNRTKLFTKSTLICFIKILKFSAYPFRVTFPSSIFQRLRVECDADLLAANIHLFYN